MNLLSKLNSSVKTRTIDPREIFIQKHRDTDIPEMFKAKCGKSGLI